MGKIICFIIMLSMLISLLCGCSYGNSTLPSDTEKSTETEATKGESTKNPTARPTEPPVENEPTSTRKEFDEHGRKISWSDVDPREAFGKLNVGMSYAEICDVFGTTGTGWQGASGYLYYFWNFDFEGEWIEARICFSYFPRDNFNSNEEWMYAANLMISGILYEVITHKRVDNIFGWTKPSDIKVERMIVMEKYHDKPYEYTEENIVEGVHQLLTSLETSSGSDNGSYELSVEELLNKQIRFYYSNNNWQDFYLSSCGKYLKKRYFIEGVMYTNQTYYIGEAQAEMIYDAIYSLPIDEAHEYDPTEITE